MAYYNYIERKPTNMTKNTLLATVAATVAIAASSILGQMVLTQEATVRCYGPALAEAPACQFYAPHAN